MSFVLEALKKQEAGSNPETAAALAVAGIAQRRYRLWTGVAIAALVVNAAALTWLVGGHWLRAAAPAKAEVTQVPLAAEPSAVIDTGMASVPTDAPATSGVPAPAPAAAVPAPAVPAPAVPAPAVQRVTRLALQDLPAAARRRFPGIAFSTHIYAEDRDLRAVVANGQRLTEGDTVRGLTIEEISATGVVLAFESYLVDVPLVADWSDDD